MTPSNVHQPTAARTGKLHTTATYTYNLQVYKIHINTEVALHAVPVSEPCIHRNLIPSLYFSAAQPPPPSC